MDLVTCTSAFSRTVGKQRVVLRVGDILRADDPVVKGCEQHFKPVEDAVRVFGHTPKRVEQATAEPGEKREVPHTRARKRNRARNLTEVNEPETESTDE